MKEAEWLRTGDVGAMLRFLTQTRSGESIPTEDWRISQEEVRWFDEACWVHFGLTVDQVGEQAEVGKGAADALRCIRGNPWRGLDLDLRWFCKIHRKELDGSRCEGCRGWPPLGEAEVVCPWVTPAAAMLVESLGKGEGGKLDPVAVLALADALEEAGCPTDHPCTHVVEMPKGPGGQMMPICRRCPEGYGPHPLLEHLRSPGPHYAGCHAVRALGGWR